MSVPLVIVAVAAVLGAWVTLVRPTLAVCLLAALLPWRGLELEAGLRVTAFRAALAGVVLATVLRAAVVRSARRDWPGWAAVATALVLSVGTSLFQAAIVPEAAFAGGALRTSFPRACSQIVRHLLVVSPLLLVPKLLRRPGEVALACRSYLASLVCLVALGAYQLAALYSTGVDPTPVGVLTNWSAPGLGVRTGSIPYTGITVYRMASLGGEPRDLGAALAVGLVVLQFAPGRAVITLRRAALWSALFVALCLTLSTSALAIWLAGTLALGLAALRTIAPARAVVYLLARVAFLGGCALLGLLLLAEGISATRGGDPVTHLLQLVASRTVERVTVEDFDAAVLGYLISSPGAALTGAGIGNAHIYAEAFLPANAVAYARGTVFVAKIGALKVVSEQGILVAPLWFVGAASLCRHLGSTHRSESGQASESRGLARTALAASAAGFAMASALEETFFLAFGLAAAAAPPRRAAVIQVQPVRIDQTGNSVPPAAVEASR